MTKVRPDLSRLKSVLLTSGLQTKDNPTFQVINSLVDLVTQGIDFSANAGANTLLSNLIATTINMDLIPISSNNKNIGSSAIPWKTLYLGTSLISPILYGSEIANGDLVIGATSHATQSTSFITLQNLAGVIINPSSDTQSTLVINRATGVGMMFLGTYPGFASYAGFWAGAVTPGGSNYTLISDGSTETIFNAPSGGKLFFRIAHANTPSGAVLTGVGFGIRVDSPTARLHLPAGATAANSAPLKLTSGSLLTSPEAGAIEFLTDAYYATITTGAARKTFAFLESPSFTTPNIGAASGASLSLSNTINLPSTGAAPTAGSVTLVAGTATVNTTAVTATCLIFFQRITAGGTIGFATTYTKVAGTSFTINSDSALDTSTYAWHIIETH